MLLLPLQVLATKYSIRAQNHCYYYYTMTTGGPMNADGTGWTGSSPSTSRSVCAATWSNVWRRRDPNQRHRLKFWNWLPWILQSISKISTKWTWDECYPYWKIFTNSCYCNIIDIMIDLTIDLDRCDLPCLGSAVKLSFWLQEGDIVLLERLPPVCRIECRWYVCVYIYILFIFLLNFIHLFSGRVLWILGMEMHWWSVFNLVFSWAIYIIAIFLLLKRNGSSAFVRDICRFSMKQFIPKKPTKSLAIIFFYSQAAVGVIEVWTFENGSALRDAQLGA